MRICPAESFIDKIICGDCLKTMKQMPNESVNMCMTSPPYWGLRDYGVEGQYGLEETPELYIERMTAVFREVKRVLRKDGVLFLNMGDTYSSDSTVRVAGKDAFLRKGDNGYKDYLASERHAGKSDKKRRTFKEQHLPSKCLCMVPERLAWSLIQDGWILRNKIIWYKPAGMPSSVKDRFTSKWEYVYMFSKNNKTILWQHKETREWVDVKPLGVNGEEGIDWKWKEDKKTSLWRGFTYYFDLDAVREETIWQGKQWGDVGKKFKDKGLVSDHEFKDHPLGKNPGDVFIIPTETRTMGAIIGTGGGVKVPGGKGWTGHPQGGGAACQKDPRWCPPDGKNPGDFWSISTQPFPEAHFAVFPEKLCEKPIKAGCREDDIVLDPFCGAGTTLYVAKKMKRHYVGIDIKREFCRMSEKRIAQGIP